MKIAKILPIILGTAFLLVAVPVLAQNKTATPPLQQKNQEKTQERWQERCQKTESKINEKIAKFEKNRGNHILRYQKAFSLLQRIENKLRLRGQDTETLKEKITALDTMIKEYAANYQNFIDELKGTENYVCGESKGKFISELNQARKEWREAHTKRFEIKKFIWEEVRPEILKLHKAYRASENEENGAVNNSAENSEE